MIPSRKPLFLKETLVALTQTQTAPLTLLDAVNTLLRAIGSTEVASLTTADMDQRAQGALAVLNEQSVEVQSRGWHFNQEDEFPLMPDLDKKIVLPLNLARFTVSARSVGEDVTQRGRYLYDRTRHTFEFNKTIYGDIVLVMEWAHIPAPVRWYITCLAGRIFGVGRKPDANTYRFSEAEEKAAESRALQFNTDAQGTNLPETSPHFRNMRRR